MRTAKVFICTFCVLTFLSSAHAMWAPSVRGLVVGAGFGFASGPVGESGGDDFAGLGGYIFVGRELGGLVTLGGKFEGYVYDDARYDYPYDNRVDRAVYEVAVSSRFYPVGFFGLRPYVGGDAGVYIIMNRDEAAVEDFSKRIEPGITGRTGLEVFIVNSLAVDFGVSYSMDAAERERLNVTTGYVGAVLYF
ncbi:MAG: hypothetical protein JSW52_05880 [Candidatus Coatesbacteria bacterium]|nr:MAG: hypothetical protein JSW52_05880 [Candidatus Coatesbacteria bacterium]